MATPILDIVPSYSVDNGVTLTFDANYSTNLIRGSKVTIRDQERNILATHIYIPDTYNEASTQHVIPSKQALINESVAPSAYSSGVTYQVDAIVTYNGSTYRCVKLAYNHAPNEVDYWIKVATGEVILSYVSEDFNTKYVDETQLQFIVTVFVKYTVSDYNITLIGEGENSNVMSAWLLPQPTITFDTIPTTIDTTSYVIGLTYNTNQTQSIGRVYNPPQSMTFSLYRYINDVWEPVAGEDQIYNSGTPISDTSYYANYSFNSLINGVTYKILVSIKSLLGMNVIAETPSFTVDAITYQISSLDVINDSCNGKVDIISKIADVIGESDAEAQDGEIDLTNNTCTWAQGLGFTNNWTSRFWAYNLHIADAIEQRQAIVHYESSLTGGVIDGYMVEDPNGYRFDLYVYASGYDGVVNYYQSNVVDTVGTQSNPICILIGFDYTNSGTYYVRVLTS